MRRVTGISTPLFGVSWQPPGAEQAAGQQKADVRVSLVGTGRDARFVISNVGEGTAHDVVFDIQQEENQGSPLVQGDYDKKLPIVVLRAGDRVELLAALTFGTGVVFNGRWQWCDEDGSPQHRAEKVSLQRY